MMEGGGRMANREKLQEENSRFFMSSFCCNHLQMQISATIAPPVFSSGGIISGMSTKKCEVGTPINRERGAKYKSPEARGAGRAGCRAKNAKGHEGRSSHAQSRLIAPDYGKLRLKNFEKGYPPSPATVDRRPKNMKITERTHFFEASGCQRNGYAKDTPKRRRVEKPNKWSISCLNCAKEAETRLVFVETVFFDDGKWSFETRWNTDKDIWPDIRTEVKMN